MYEFRFNFVSFNQFAVEGMGAIGAKGVAPIEGDDTDPTGSPCSLRS
jgi:hypothetical protein